VGEPGDVGVVADGLAVADEDGVERADDRDLRRQPVHQRHHHLLHRVRDVQPVEPEVDGGREQRPEVVRRDGVVAELHDLVDVPQPVPHALALVELGRQRRPHALAEQAGEEGAPRPGPGHRPSRCGR
jgi:hypothetical protein